MKSPGVIASFATLYQGRGYFRGVAISRSVVISTTRPALDTDRVVKAFICW